MSDAGISVADIGAGTGKLTAQLLEETRALESGVRVVAVEPSGDMRAELVRVLPQIASGDVMPTTAESTGLDEASFDLLTYAQAWHWLDEDVAAREAARVLKPGGTLALLFNQMDVSIPWVKRLTRIMRSGDVHRWSVPPNLGEQFSTPELAIHYDRQYLHPKEVLALGRTRSSWIKSSEANREKMQGNLRWYLYERLGYREENLVEIPYRTFVWTARRLSAR